MNGKGKEKEEKRRSWLPMDVELSGEENGEEINEKGK